MKKIFLICLTAGFISTGFAQSSVEDVPENKIKPAYDLVQPAKKAEAQQKQTPKNTVQSPVIITDKNSSLYEENKKEVAKPTPDVSGSVADMPVNKATPKIIDNTGSVMDTPAAKPSDKKVDINGSVLDTPAAKPSDKKLTNDGSVAPDTKKTEAKPVAKPTGAQSVNG